MRNKRLIALLLSVLLLAAIVVPVYAENGVIHIGTAEELRKLSERCRLDSYSKELTVVLDCDIDLKNEPFSPIPAFAGTFIGGGHTIYGFVPLTDGSRQGLFKCILEGGTVRNLAVQGTVDPTTVRTEIGGLVGVNYGTVAACTFTGDVRGLERVGGIAGENNGTLLDCKCYGTVAGKRFTGGITGSNTGTVAYCKNYASVNTVIETKGVNIDDIQISDISMIPIVSAGDSDVVSDSGGIAGLSTGIISECSNSGTVGYQHFGYNVGGIAGRHSGFITGCSNYGQIYGRKDIAGIVGQMEPFMLLTATDDLIGELALLSEALNIAMTHLDSNADITSDAMDNISEDTNDMKKSLEEMDILTGVFFKEDDEEGGIDWNNLNQKGKDFRTWALDSYDSLDEETKERIKSGELTDEDWEEIYNKSDAALGDKDEELVEKTGENAGEIYNRADEFARREKEKADDISGRLGDETMEHITSGDFDDITDEDWERIIGTGGEVLDEGTDDAAYRLTKLQEKRQAEEIKKENERAAAADDVAYQVDSVAYNIKKLNEALSASTKELAADMKVVNYHFCKVMTIMANLLGGKVVIYEDISDYDNEELTDGKVFTSTNFGTVEGDISVGGIAGEMGIEIENDMEGVIDTELDVRELVNNTYDARCVARDCVNDGTVTGKKDNVGGVVGYSKMGTVIGCEGYGSVSSEDGSYVGGVVGLSETVVRESYALCSVDGKSYVGGVAGSAAKIRNCGSRVEINELIPVSGAIAGWADVMKEEQVPENSEDYNSDELKYVRGNIFVSDNIGGIDGISYADAAVPMSDEEFMELEELPLRFKEITVTFNAGGTQVAAATGIFGEALAPELIPEVPEKSGYSGYWPDFDFDELRADAVLEAEYYPKQASLATAETREGSPKSMILLTGSFDDRAKLTVSEYDGYEPEIKNCTVKELWTLHIDGNREENAAYSVHFIEPETDRNSIIYIYVSDGSAWRHVATKTNNDYTVFPGSGNEMSFAAVEVPVKNVGSAVLTAVIVLGLCAGAAAVFFSVKKKKAAEKA